MSHCLMCLRWCGPGCPRRVASEAARDARLLREALPQRPKARSPDVIEFDVPQGEARDQ